jgi:aspartyl aminopeptidase
MISDLREHLDWAPTSLHVVEFWRRRLVEQGFVEVSSSAPLPDRGFTSRQGAVISWINGNAFNNLGFRIVGAHTDSPGLHIKPNPVARFGDMQQLNVEIYGGPLLNSWLDRDLGIAGIVHLRSGENVLVKSARPVARIPQLAIHLDREISDKGLLLDKQRHLRPIWGIGKKITQFEDFLASEFGLAIADIIGWDCQLFDMQLSEVFGLDNEFLASARIDNQVSCWAAMSALVNSTTSQPSMVALFDHEEVGSQSPTGAAGPLLEHILEQISMQNNGNRRTFIEALAKTHCASTDCAHAIHPNYPERHDEQTAPVINGGVVLKSNSNQRYATTSHSSIPVIHAAEKSNVSLQYFTSRNNIACGSTIGPITATRLGIETVDIGIPQLAMHSAREMCGAQDPIDLRHLLTSYFER